ncbi:hypothetical protein [Actinoplanes sp. URMC 104]|uniref:tetratricopeptide repeat protein n=1 Tax=Actinoplanes sp. URMC 104 TaxID=3423409 RepID=UPI003F1A8C77
MSADERRQGGRRARQVEKLDLPEGPGRQLRDALYELYLRADGPTLDELVASIAAADDLPGSPGRDTVSRILSGREPPATSQDAVTIAVALARLGGRDSAVVADRVKELWVAAKMAPPPAMPEQLGTPIRDCDPIGLEVHRAIDIPGPQGATTVLPGYVEREHDKRLTGIVAAAVSGNSRIAVMVGGSSTGKTRACWEAVRSLPDRWRLWHPIDPSRSAAAAGALAQVGAYTVVWLNEAQQYLLTVDPLEGEAVAAGLRTLLADASRSPVLVLATMWPHYWSTLTTRPDPNRPDPYAQARELLAGADIAVPDSFSAGDLRNLQSVAAHDPRLQHAARYAQDGRVTQHLAGVPELLARYRNAQPAAKAIIEVAVDARRLGHLVDIPHALLETAAPGYLSDFDWHQLGEDWLRQALTYTARPCHGVPGPLTPVRRRPDDAPSDGPRYRLADYLDQTGRAERAGRFPPAAFWNAAVTAITDARLLYDLGRQAEYRGRYHRAAQLYWHAGRRGSVQAHLDLAVLLRRAGEARAAEVLYRRLAEGGHLGALWPLAEMLQEAGDAAGAEAHYRELADRGNLSGLWALAGMRQKTGDTAAAEAIYREAADRGNTGALMEIAAMRVQMGDVAGAEAVCREAADRGDIGPLVELGQMRERAGDEDGARALYRQAAESRARGASVRSAGAMGAVNRSAVDNGGAGAQTQPSGTPKAGGGSVKDEAHYRRAVDGGNVVALLHLAGLRERAGDMAGAEAIYLRAAEHGNVAALMGLAGLKERAGDLAEAEALCGRAADHGTAVALTELAAMRERAGDTFGAGCVRRFGLADDGSVAASLKVDIAGLPLSASA